MLWNGPSVRPVAVSTDTTSFLGGWGGCEAPVSSRPTVSGTASSCGPKGEGPQPCARDAPPCPKAEGTAGSGEVV